MAYERPKQWEHGDIPTAADFNHYTNSLIYLNPFFVVRAFHTARKDNGGDGVTFAVTKRFRWFHYIVASGKDDGQIQDPAGVFEAVALDKGSGGWVVLDLNGIDWLTPGFLYLVEDVAVALESSDNPTASSIT